jgi:hypothetical protein
MATETIDHSTLSRLVEAGAVRNAHVVGQEGGWAVLVKYGMAERALMAQRSQQVRLFKRMETLVSYLKELGISHFEVNAAGYAPEKVRTYLRPDRAEALRRAHEAAAHDKWFRSQVEDALREADDPATEWVSHETVKQDMAQQRAALQTRLKGR